MAIIPYLSFPRKRESIPWGRQPIMMDSRFRGNDTLKVILFFLILAGPPYSQPSLTSEPPIPTFTSPVYDETGTLSSDQKLQLEQKLRAFEDSTSTQIVVAIVQTTGGYPISDYAVKLFDQNKI